MIPLPAHAHVPALQTPLLGHVIPQAPQLCLSVSMSTQLVPPQVTHDAVASPASIVAPGLPDVAPIAASGERSVSSWTPSNPLQLVTRKSAAPSQTSRLRMVLCEQAEHGTGASESGGRAA
ncbi:MAG: hypothetical protein M3O50_10780 [Myxococcota bacterium]|nr:hypothetical protein [Myxococcota bacterium]